MAVEVRCIRKERDKNNAIVNYIIRQTKGDPNNRTDYRVPSDTLKKSIREGKVTVSNLKLTSDNRLINHNERLKVVFFDIDGVLNYFMSDEIIDDECVDRLINIVDKTGAKLVLSSNWRYWLANTSHPLPDENKDALKKLIRKLGDRFIGITPIMSSNGVIVEDYRELEVKKWLEENTNVDKFVILDDNTFGFRKMYPNNFVLTSGEDEEGLTDDDMNKAIRILQ